MAGFGKLRLHPRQDRFEALLLQEFNQRFGVGFFQLERFIAGLYRRVLREPNQIARDTRLIRELDQILAAFGLFDFPGAFQQRIEVAIFGDQLRRGLDPDSRHARHVIGGIAGQRLHIDHLVGMHAETLFDLRIGDRRVLHRIHHRDIVIDELHQILVA